MLWKNDGYWHYETFSFHEPPATFGVFEPMVELWRAKTPAGAAAPDWRHFELTDLKGWWGWSHVYDAVPGEPLHFRVRLWGSNIASVLGYDVTGQLLRPETAAGAADAQNITRDDLEFARYLLDNAQLGRGSGPIDARFGNVCDYQEIMLPLSGDGQTLDKVLYFCSTVMTGVER
ncbi:MAG: hypothetical protein RIC16_05025 [Rhodospirillales bacterium]